MYQKERIDSITDILKKNGYVTVKYLTQELHYSTATINRDLNYMEKQKLIKRSYGGVELVKRKYVPLVFRYNKMRTAKNLIGKAAAKFINDGDIIFFDGSTTTQYISKYITEKKDLTVITNNMALASFLSEYSINVICLGGKIIEAPYILGDEDTIENSMKYNVDKFFFSVGKVTPDGKIMTGGWTYLLCRIMLKNSKESFLLADRDKFFSEPSASANKILCTPDKITHIITDYTFSEKIKNKYPETDFVELK